jgi:hypothetical protein
MKNFALFLSGNTFKRMNKYRMRWYGHVACVEEKTYTGFSWEILKERTYLEDLRAESNKVLKWI